MLIRARPSALDADHRARDAVADQARADREQRDRDDGQDDRPGLDGEAVAVLVDHQTPVGGRRLEAEAEEAQPRHDGDVERHPQRRLDDERARDVRQHLAQEDAPAGEADRLGRAHEVLLDDLDRGAARDAGGSRRRREPDREHEQPQLRADRRREHEREDDLREREQDVHAAHEHVVELAPRVGRDQADRHSS